MPIPRYVSARLTGGRSILVSLQGKMERLRKGDDPKMIPWAVYKRFAHKLELCGDSIGQVNAAMHEGEIHTTAPQVMTEGGWAGPTATSEDEPAAGKEAEPLPTWPLPTPPEEYVRLFGKRKNKSKLIKERIALAKRILAAAEGPDG